MELKDSYCVISENKNHIINEWLKSQPLLEILKKISFTPSKYKSDVALPVLNYLLSVIKEEESIGDCPAMRKVVETFLNSGLYVEDVFLNCTIFKNSVLESLHLNGIKIDEIRKVTNILDTNLHRILGIYTKEKNKKDARSSFHSDLIKEHVALSTTDTNGVITYVTEAFCKLSGYSESELLGKTHSMITHSDMPNDFFKSMWSKIKKNKVWKGKVKNRKKGGGEFIAKTEIIPYIDEDGNVVEYVAIRHDITDKELSNIDPLTGMYNRRYYKSVINNIFETYLQISVMVVDIDHFKKINDNYGHSFGDLVLKEFSKVLSNKIRKMDICIRWGGEEFVILLPDTNLEKATDIAERIRTTIESLEILDENSGKSVDIKCSIGVTGRNNDDTSSSMFDRADGNLYTAKNSGRNMVISK